MASRPNRIDIHVGGRVRLRRTLLGMSQDKLAQALGLTFQQVQKYERGANRIGSSKPYQLPQILDVPVCFFLDDMPADVAAAGGGRGMTDAEQGAVDPETLSRRMTLEFVRAYYRIPDEPSAPQGLRVGQSRLSKGRGRVVSDLHSL